MNRFNQMCSTMRRTLNNKKRQDTHNISESYGGTYTYIWVRNLEYNK
jgi:hypothetical protein